MFPTDLSILTPTDQDRVKNSNGSLSCWTGVGDLPHWRDGERVEEPYSGST
jgi:hypothetical protein